MDYAHDVRYSCSGGRDYRQLRLKPSARTPGTYRYASRVVPVSDSRTYAMDWLPEPMVLVHGRRRTRATMTSDCDNPNCIMHNPPEPENPDDPAYD